jgi:hypothetical protein
VNDFKAPFRMGFPAALAGTTVLFLFGCVGVGGGDYTEVDSDYGYVGPWTYGTFEAAGYEGARPPYERPGGHEREGVAPGSDHHEAPPQGHAPAPVHNNPRPPPSIPNNPRPSGGGGGSRGGGSSGGGGHSGGGGGGNAGGGSHGSGGGGNGKR